jgi:hypothetical protein
MGRCAVLRAVYFAIFPFADPFGHSAFQGVLSSALGGYNGLIWGREPADFFAQSMNGRLERVWLPSPSLGGAAATMQGVFVEGGYSTPGEGAWHATSLALCRLKFPFVAPLRLQLAAVTTLAFLESTCAAHMTQLR